MKKNSSIDISTYPTTRYQGSKRKILPWIYENLKNIDFHTVLDGCGGSASVSYLFKKMNKAVTYNDNLKFNYISGKALIENQNILLNDEDIRNLLGSQVIAPDTISKIFKDIYYLEEENHWLDKVTNSILNMNHYVGTELEYKKAIAYHALFQACLIKRPFNLFHRRNLNIRTADVERNFGNKTTWEKDFNESFTEFVKEINTCIFNSNTQCRAINESIFTLQDVDYDLVYLDPPYINTDGSNETSNYLKCYHFLEGLANYDTWENLIDYETTNLRMKGATKDNFFNKENIYDSLEFLIDKFQNSKIVISYKKGGTPSIDSIVRIMKKYKSKVITRSQHYIYALNKQNGNALLNKEVLIIGI